MQSYFPSPSFSRFLHHECPQEGEGEENGSGKEHFSLWCILYQGVNESISLSLYLNSSQTDGAWTQIMSCDQIVLSHLHLLPPTVNYLLLSIFPLQILIHKGEKGMEQETHLKMSLFSEEGKINNLFSHWIFLWSRNREEEMLVVQTRGFLNADDALELFSSFSPSQE